MKPIALRLAALALTTVLAPGLPARAQSCTGSFTEVSPYGFYTDRPVYPEGGTVVIHDKWPGGPSGTGTYVKYQLTPLHTSLSTPYPRTAERYHDASSNAPLPYGSFVEFVAVPNLSAKTFSLAGLQRFTLAGWIRPSFVHHGEANTAEAVVLAGQIATDGSGSGLANLVGGAGIGITESGKLFGLVTTSAGTTTIVDDGAALDEDVWRFVAVTYNGSKLRLLADDGAGEVVSVADPVDVTGGVVVLSSAYSEWKSFRLGARQSAPGPITGLYDGRLDDWTAWRQKLTSVALQVLHDHGSPPPGTWHLDLPAPAQRILDVDFEDSYGIRLVDHSGKGNHGSLVHHGTPGMHGHRDGSHALRLNLDQLVDAGFQSGNDPDPAVTLTLDLTGVPPGLYAVQAVFKDGFYDPNTAENQDPSHFQCIVVRPDATSIGTAPAAVILPVNTWIAYNGWPGSNSVFSGKTAPGLCVRTVNGSAYPQGNNSAYGFMGDYDSRPHYSGWQRPNSQARPTTATGGFASRAPTSVALVQWLQSFVDGGTCPGFDFEVYTDWDLHDGTLPVDAHPIWITGGHHEYWSRAMLDALHEHLDDGGDVINLGGNLFAYRSEIAFSDPVTGANTGVIEVKKWPTRIDMIGTGDAESLIAGDQSYTGYWRFLGQVERIEWEVAHPGQTAPPRLGRDDMILGTLNDVVGGCSPAASCFGDFHAASTSSSLWGTNPPVSGAVIATDIVGDEADGFLPLETLDVDFPFGENEDRDDVEELATGKNFTDGVPVVRWDGADPSYPLFTADRQQLNQWAIDEPQAFGLNSFETYIGVGGTPDTDHASIVYYEHRDGGTTPNGGRVFNANAIAAPTRLGADPLYTTLVENAICSFLGGE